MSIQPGETPAKWETQFFTEHHRREVLEGNLGVTRRAGNEELEQECNARAQESTNRLWRSVSVAYEDSHKFQIRVALRLANEKVLRSKPISIPPLTFLERIEAARGHERRAVLTARVDAPSFAPGLADTPQHPEESTSEGR